MFLRNSFFIQHRDTACGLWSPRLRGPKPWAPWVEGAASVGHDDISQAPWEYLLYPHGNIPHDLREISEYPYSRY